MADLVVDALGLGTGKQEDGVAAEIFAAFGIDLVELGRSVPQRTADRARVLRQLAATELSTTAPSTGSIVAELARAGGLLVAMAEEVYQLLTDHDATTTGTSEGFTIALADLGGVELTLSPAFFEDVTRLITESVTTSIPGLDHDALREFLRLDNGVPYGQWPLVEVADRFPLPAEVLRLANALAYLETLADRDPQWATAAAQARRAQQACDRLVHTAELLVKGFAGQLAHVAGNAPTGASRASYVAEQVGAFTSGGYFDVPQAAAEVDHFLTSGDLGSTVWLVDDVGARKAYEVSMSVGIGGAIRRRVEPTDVDHPASAVAGLASWCVLFREGVDPNRRGEELRVRLTSVDAWSHWLTTLVAVCEEATAWMDAMLRDVQHESSGERVRETVEHLLNLPLWRHRDLLYEVWVLVATMRACAQAGADLELTGLEHGSRDWVLPGSRASRPVADVVFRPGGHRLGVWREPLRVIANNELTPDVTISIPGAIPRDLVVVEAKDRIKMAEAKAVEVGRRYANELSPRLTWVVNHCELRLARGGADSTASTTEMRNYGDPWHPIHLAGRFRPGSVPAAFADTIVAAIRPTGAAGPRS